MTIIGLIAGVQAPLLLVTHAYVYLSIVWPLPAYTVARSHWFPKFPDLDHSEFQLVPFAELSRTADPMLAPHMWY